MQAKPSDSQLAFAKRQAQFISKHALWIVIGFCLATAALIPVASKLKLHANFLDLLPSSHPSVKNLKDLTGHVGGTSFLIAVFESPDEETVKIAAEEFSKKAVSFPEIEYIDNRTNISAFKNRKLLFLTLDGVKQVKAHIESLIDYHRRKNNPFFVDLLDEKEPELNIRSLPLEEKILRIGGFSAQEAGSFMQVVLLKPKHPVSEFIKSESLFSKSESIFAEIQKNATHPVTMGFTGPYRTRFNEYKTINRDLQRTGLAAMVLLVIINLLGFRNLRSIIYAYLPLSLATIWVWAFTQVTIGYLNLITAFLAAILFGMGGDYTFHILVSFEEDLQISKKVEDAIEMTFSELWKPLWVSMWTTAVVFYAMTISKFEGFHHFGIIAGVGIVISFLIVLYFQPSLMILGEKYFPPRRPTFAKNKTIKKKTTYAIVLLGVIFSIYSFTQIPKVKFNYDFTELRARGDNAVDLSERVGTHFGVRLMPVAFVTPDRAQASELAKTINQYIERKADTTFDFASSINSHIPRDQNEKIEILHKIQGILDKHNSIIQKLDSSTRKKIAEFQEQLSPQPLSFEDLPEQIRHQYEGKDQQISIVFVYPKIRILDGRNAKHFVKELRSLQLPPGVKLAGEPVIYADILGLMEHDTPIAIGISFFLVFILVLFHFKRLDHTLWVHAPLLIGVLWMEGLMGAFGLSYNFFNMAIVPSILGVGIDNGIYIFDRFKERGNENFFQSMGKSLKGVLMSSATNISGFASLMFATHNGIASMGKFGFCGFLCCLLSSVFFIPAVIEIAELKSRTFVRRNQKTLDESSASARS